MAESKAKPRKKSKPRITPGLGFRVDDRVRAKIQTTMIINRLQDYVKGTLGPDKKPKVVMSQTQVTAAGILLKKAIPDLTSIDLKGDVDLNHTFIHRLE